MLRFASAVALILPLVVVGCSAENPEDLPNLLPDAGMGQDDPGVVSLSVDEYDVSTPWYHMVVTGKGPAGGTLAYINGNGGKRTEPLSTSGEFCVRVDLKDGSNALKFEAIDADGEYSEAVYVNTTREGDPPEIVVEPIDGPNIGDRTTGSTFYGTSDGGDSENMELFEGQWTDLIDTNESQRVWYGGVGVDNEAVIFELSKAMKVHGFVVDVPAVDSPSCGPEALAMWVANDPDPGYEIDSGSQTWIKVAEVVTSGAVEPVLDHLPGGGTYELENFLAMRGIEATHFALMGTNASCGLWPWNSYGVSEVRVLAEKDGTEVPPVSDPGPSCLDGSR